MAKRASDDDKTTVWLVRTPEGLRPSSAFDAEEIERYPMGAVLTTTIMQPRDETLMRFYHAFCGRVAKGLGMDPESFKWQLKIKLGLVREARMWDGAVSFTPRSLRELDNADLREYVDRVVNFVITEIVPGADVEEIMNKTYRYAGMPTIEGPKP